MTELIKNLSETFWLQKKQVKQLLDAVRADYFSKLLKWEFVNVLNLGSFKVRAIPPRTYRNPRTGEPVIKWERKVIKYKQSKKINVN